MIAQRGLLLWWRTQKSSGGLALRLWWRGLVVSQHSKNQPEEATSVKDGLAKEIGPSGFISYEDATYVVDFGRILGLDGAQIGFLYEDGHVKCDGEPLGRKQKLVPIDEFEGMVFRGIDSGGFELELPGEHLDRPEN